MILDMGESMKPRRGVARSGRIAVAAATLTLFAGACGNEKAGNAGASTDESSEKSTSSAPVNRKNWPKATVTGGLAEGMQLPIEKYLMSYPEYVTVTQAEITAKRECMARFGFDFPATPPGTYPPEEYNAANMKRRYGITDLAEARVLAYNTSGAEEDEGPVEEDLESAEADMVYDLTVADGQAIPDTYNGEPIPEGGCLGEATRTIGSYDDDLAEDLNARSWEAAQEDPRVVEVTKAWAACMSVKGYSLSTPYKALDEVTRQSMAHSEETATAVADVTCKEETGLVATTFEVETALQRTYIQDHLTDLEKAEVNNNTTVREAQQFLD